MTQLAGECGSALQLKQKHLPHRHCGSPGRPSVPRGARTALPQCGVDGHQVTRALSSAYESRSARSYVAADSGSRDRMMRKTSGSGTTAAHFGAMQRSLRLCPSPMRDFRWPDQQSSQKAWPHAVRRVAWEGSTSSIHTIHEIVVPPSISMGASAPSGRISPAAAMSAWGPWSAKVDSMRLTSQRKCIINARACHFSSPSISIRPLSSAEGAETSASGETTS
mmetsp:Transcript_2628/g.7824  ORF Transcript_2628/g.7824 Transcript_2628/m.7824 type:complete len:222 (-) Transcript_2628:232-897(-)